MKVFQKIIFFSFLLLPLLSFSQGKNKDFIIHSDLISESDLALEKLDFYPEDDSSIVFIEFVQDSTSLKFSNRKVYSGIYRKEGFDKMYIVGKVKDFQTEGFYVSITVKQYLIDGSIKSYVVRKHFDDLIIATDNMDYAEYSVEFEMNRKQKVEENIWEVI